VFNLKALVVTRKSLDVSKLLSSEPQVQEFLRKVSKIILLFLKDSSAPKELHRSVLKFTKVAITYLDFNKDTELCPLILSHCFALKNSKKYSMTLRRIITKLIIRVGNDKVRAATAKEHLPLVAYVERARRKKQNARERTKMLSLLG
jgi:hypothetical protein